MCSQLLLCLGFLFVSTRTLPHSSSLPSLSLSLPTQRRFITHNGFVWLSSQTLMLQYRSLCHYRHKSEAGCGVMTSDHVCLVIRFFQIDEFVWAGVFFILDFVLPWNYALDQFCLISYRGCWVWPRVTDKPLYLFLFYNSMLLLTLVLLKFSKLCKWIMEFIFCLTWCRQNGQFLTLFIWCFCTLCRLKRQFWSWPFCKKIGLLCPQLCTDFFFINFVFKLINLICAVL